MTATREESVTDDQLVRDITDLVSRADLVTPMTIRAGVRVGLFDALASGPLTAAQLTAAVRGDHRAVRVAADHLVHEGLLTVNDGAYALSSTGTLLTEQHADLGLRDLLDPRTVVGRNESALADLHHTLRTGRPSSEAASGTTLWEELDTRSTDVTQFDWDEPGFAAELVLDAPLWSDATSVVDLGGNTGSLLLALLGRHPHLTGTVLDFPVFTTRAVVRAEERGLSDRLDVAEGSFFDQLPTGHDVYLLSAVLADWNDDDAVAILRRAADGAGDDGLVVVAEVHLVPEGGLAPVTSVAVRLEASVTRPDRTPAEVERLINAAGLVVAHADTDSTDRSLFVCRRRDGASS